MKRSEIKRTAFKRSTTVDKGQQPSTKSRQRIKPFSQQRIDDRPARSDVREVVVARDKICQFWPIIVRGRGPGPVSSSIYLDLDKNYARCMGDLVPHELAGSRNVGRLNPDECVAMCYLHNQQIEDMGEAAYALGLKVHGNGKPIRHRIDG